MNPGLGGVREILGPEGIVARRLEHYEERPQQLELATAVEDAFRDGHHLLAEAGTGVGKSFAYLLPAVLHAVQHRGEGPVVISTRTIALQQQLETVDLPFLHSVLPIEWTSVTAVGRNNYVCLRRMNLAHRERGLLFTDATREAQLNGIVDWSLDTAEGTRMDLPRPVDQAVWEEVQAEHGNCLQRACPYYDPCHYQRSRRRMDGAQILVVNHALYMADVALRLAGASYLPAHRVVVFDEAHHLERVATEHLGLRITESSVNWHLHRLHPRNAKRSLLAQYGSDRARRFWRELKDATSEFFADLEYRLEKTGREACELGDEVLEQRASELMGALGSELEANAGMVEKLDRRMELQARARGLLGMQMALETLCAPTQENNVRWLERVKRGAALRSAPLEVSQALRDAVFSADRVAVLTSATLAPGNNPAGFSWLRERLGIDEAEERRLGSPFDYHNHVQVVVEEALPDPGADQAGFLQAAKERVSEHLLDNGGSALVLCTSWRSVRELANYLRPILASADIELLVQGEDTLTRLLELKKEKVTSVLIGTDSLWEGIDIRGEALTMVVVARFPFAPPDHPLTQARMRAVEARGGNAFGDYSLPEAVLKFRQGFGRLIRSQSDRGTVVILDPRARTKAYGRAFLEALPEGALDDFAS